MWTNKINKQTNQTTTIYKVKEKKIIHQIFFLLKKPKSPVIFRFCTGVKRFKAGISNQNVFKYKHNKWKRQFVCIFLFIKISTPKNSHALNMYVEDCFSYAILFRCVSGKWTDFLCLYFFLFLKIKTDFIRIVFRIKRWKPVNWISTQYTARANTVNRKLNSLN